MYLVDKVIPIITGATAKQTRILFILPVYPCRMILYSYGHTSSKPLNKYVFQEVNFNRVHIYLPACYHLSFCTRKTRRETKHFLFQSYKDILLLRNLKFFNTSVKSISTIETSLFFFHLL